MIELRQRSFRSSSSGYQRVQTDEDAEDADASPVPVKFRKVVPQKSNATCKNPLNLWLSYASIYCIQPSVESSPTFLNFVSVGAKICFVFSLVAVIFLSILAFLLGKNSVYLKVGAEYQNNKAELVSGVLGAVFMYLACLGLSAFVWFRASRVREDDSRFLD
jgi:hypothetical protein